VKKIGIEKEKGTKLRLEKGRETGIRKESVSVRKNVSVTEIGRGIATAIRTRTERKFVKGSERKDGAVQFEMT
jgi:hypothetical protein